MIFSFRVSLDENCLTEGKMAAPWIYWAIYIYGSVGCSDASFLMTKQNDTSGIVLTSIQSHRDSNRFCALLARTPWVPPLPAAASPVILTPSVPQPQGAEAFSTPFIPRWSSKGCHSGVCRLPTSLLVHCMNTSHPHVVVDNTLWRPLPSPFRSYSTP